MYGTEREQYSPGGRWSDRKPSVSRTIRALFKKQFLIKFRTPSNVIEVVGACLIYLLIVPCYYFTRIPHQENRSPALEYASLIPSDLIMFIGETPNPTFVVGPDCERNHVIFDTIYNLTIGYLPSNITLEIRYVNTTAEVERAVYLSEVNGLGIWWDNARDDNGTLTPNLTLYRQSIYGTPDKDVYDLMRRAITLYNGHVTDLTLASLNTQVYPTTYRDEYYGCHFLVAFFIVVPCILATMPDFQTILDEKDTKVASLSFLMGCSEAAYWLVSFVTPVVITLIPYILMCFCFCYLFMMVGTSYTLMLFISFCFILAHVWFQLFLSTFMKNAATGRSTVIVFLVFTIFFCYIHYFYTLDSKNSSPVMKHVFSILPLSAYQMTVTSMYNVSFQGYGPRGWGDVIDDPYASYPIYYGIAWLLGDAVAYFLLFLLFNLLNPREFGIPLITWRDIFKISAWKRVLGRKKEVVDRGDYRSGELMEVEGLGKTYYGLKQFKALSGVRFTINAGEVIVIIGPNGAGKSTLLNTLAGAIEPTEGTIRIMGGEPTTRFAELQKLLGVCFQDNVLIGQLSIRENFLLFGAFRGIAIDKLNESIDFFAETLQLQEMLDNRAENLSGGQKRKLCIALSLLGNPPLVIMDEPTAAVDVQARQLIWKTISSLRDTTCIVTSHALEEAEAVSSRLFIVAAGRLRFSGTSTQLRNQFRCGYLLRIERDDGTVGPVLSLAQSYIRDAKISEERPDTISMPVDDAIPDFLRKMCEKQEEYGIKSYSFSVEQLEDMLLKLIMTQESAVERTY